MAMAAATVATAVMATATKTLAEALSIVAGSITAPPDPLPPEPTMTALPTAPKMATPTALPIERAKRLVPVTTPRSFQSTLAWATMSRGGGDEAESEPDDETAEWRRR